MKVIYRILTGIVILALIAGGTALHRPPTAHAAEYYVNSSVTESFCGAGTIIWFVISTWNFPAGEDVTVSETGEINTAVYASSSYIWPYGSSGLRDGPYAITGFAVAEMVV